LKSSEAFQAAQEKISNNSTNALFQTIPINFSTLVPESRSPSFELEASFAAQNKFSSLLSCSFEAQDMRSGLSNYYCLLVAATKTGSSKRRNKEGFRVNKFSLRFSYFQDYLIMRYVREFGSFLKVCCLGAARSLPFPSLPSVRFNQAEDFPRTQWIL
jgi:hypothetical protein